MSNMGLVGIVMRDESYSTYSTYSSEQIINELVKKIPRAKLEYIVKISKYYNNNKSKYNSKDTINEIIIDCMKSSSI